jgi:coproporphyrinogen III oxidase
MRVFASSEKAAFALIQLSQIQHYFVEKLAHVATGTCFKSVEWFRDNGQHGGGERFEAIDNSIFNRASVNLSQVQYEDDPKKSFLSATALSTIIHPQHPLAPSVHLHVSWTELKNGQHYWRLMADLNPAIEDPDDTQLFKHTLQKATGEYFTSGIEQGDHYFYIPALNKHRGACHFYLEGFTGNKKTSPLFAINFAKQVIGCYISILDEKLNRLPPPSDIELLQQLNYHTLYFYQVLTLDRGTTAGLLIHDQNDIGTLGSLPAYINRDLLASWVVQTPDPKNKLVQSLVDHFPKQVSVQINNKTKADIALIIRAFYQTLE